MGPPRRRQPSDPLGRKVNVYVNAALSSRLDRYAGRLNVSQVCAAALNEALDRLEEADRPKRDADQATWDYFAAVVRSPR